MANLCRKICSLAARNSRCVSGLTNPSNRSLNRCVAVNAKTSICCRQLSTDADASEYKYEVSSDSNEWKFVEDLLPPTYIPPVPEHSSYPTPSGWLPPDPSKYADLPYQIQRTKNRVLPVYLEQSDAYRRKFTRIRGIQGDIWALEADVKSYIESKYPDETPVLTQVHEPGRWLRIRGVYTDDIAQMLIEKGF